MLNVDLRAISDEIERAGHGHKGAIIKRYAATLGVSRDTIYRELRKKFGKKRTFKRPKTIEESLIEIISDMKLRGMDLTLKKRELATERCIRILRSQGIPGAEKLTVSSVNRRLVAAGFRIRDPKVRIEASFANQEHQLDFSRSKYFQLWKYDSEIGDYLLRVSGRELHYKKGDRRLRTWICQVKDSFSRLRVALAFAATSEDGFIGLETLDWLFNRPQDENPMRYAPIMLKTDNGSFCRRKEVRALAEALDIDMRQSAPYNHDSQGKIESAFSSLWRCFELELALRLGDGKTIHLGEYNELLHEFTIEEGRKQHPIYNDSRDAIFRKSIMEVPPREVSADLLRIACKVELRTVPQTLAVRFGGEFFQAPSYADGKRIRVYKNMLGELMGELMEEDRKPFVLTPYQYREIDDFEHRPHQTYQQKRRQVIAERAAEERRDKRVFMPPKPTQISPDSPFAESAEIAPEFPSVYAARVYIGERLRAFGQTYLDYADVFGPMLDEDLSKAGIDAVLESIAQTNRMRLAI